MPAIGLVAVTILAAAAVASAGGQPAPGGPCSTEGVPAGGGPGVTFLCVKENGKLVWQRLSPGTSGASTLSPAAAGRMLSDGKCKGTGDAVFTHLPMRPQDFGFLIPYGLMIGGHVTPIDHQYFTPADYKSPRDSYPVYAMADATITSIGPRVKPQGTEYRLIFAHSCTFLYYYDLVTSLTGKVKAAYAAHGQSVNVPIKAGDQIGMIGGQTLDFAVWKTTTRLRGFVVPAHYDAEGWKIHTTDPFPFYTPALRTLLLGRDPRVVAPRAGKIDYDVDGKLIGSWFEGSRGFAGNGGPNPFTSHLSFSPDLYDPSHFIISIGSLYKGTEDEPTMQHVAATNAPDPKTVGVATGLVKYDLVSWQYRKPDGAFWDQMGFAKNVTVVPETSRPFGCALARLTAKRTLRFEAVVGKSCSAVTGFDAAAKTYTR
jgi:hypothetical protein